MLYFQRTKEYKTEEVTVLKKQLNRVLSLLLVFMMLLSMAACGQGNPTTGTPTQPAIPEPTLPKEEGTNQLTI